MADDFEDDDLNALSQKYDDLLDSGKRRDFSKIVAQGSFKHIGADEQNRPIFVCIPALIESDTMELFIEYVVCTMDPLVIRDYIVIVCNSLSSVLNTSLLTIAKSLYDCLPRKYKKNLKSVTVLHADATFKLFLTGLSKFVSEKVWQKVVMVDYLRDVNLGGNFSKAEIPKFFPYLVHRYDAELLKAANRLGTRVMPSHFGIPITSQISSSWVPVDPLTKERCLPKGILELFTYLATSEVVRIKDIFTGRQLQNPSDLYVLIEDLDAGVPRLEFDPPEAVAALMKLFLDSLPEPLLGMDVIQTFNNSDKGKILAKQWMDVVTQINQQDDKGAAKDDALTAKLLREKLQIERNRDSLLEDFLTNRVKKLVPAHKSLVERVVNLLVRSATQMSMRTVSQLEQEAEYFRVIECASRLYAPCFTRPSRFDIRAGVKTQLGMNTGQALTLFLLLHKGSSSIGGVGESVYVKVKTEGVHSFLKKDGRRAAGAVLAGDDEAEEETQKKKVTAAVIESQGGKKAAMASNLDDVEDEDLKREMELALQAARENLKKEKESSS